MRIALRAGIMMAIGWLAAGPALAQTAPTLPGGATSLKETFEDWIVSCAITDGQKRCALAQQQANQQTRQLVLAIELAPVDAKVDGSLVLPFGLDLAKGAALQIGDQPAGAPLTFRTCLPVGCLVNVSFDDKAAKELRAAAALKVTAHADGAKDPINFSISLKGFSAALDRVQALIK